MSENLSLSITVCINRGVTCYECGGGRNCISIGRYYGRSAVGASGLELGPSGRRRPRRGRGLRIVECGSEQMTSSGRRVVLGLLGMAGAPGLTLRVMDFLGDAHNS